MKRFALLSVILALAVRLAVPTGWMPGGKSFELTVCTGVDTQTVWMDSEGKLHKQKPLGEHKQQPCAFAAVGAFAGQADINSNISLLPHEAEKSAGIPHVSVGQGLAAPPPRQTGPPLLI